MFPIHHDSHWMLVVISVVDQLIIFCDSLKDERYHPELWLNDTLLFLDYYYPDLKGRWKYDYLDDSECFQNPAETVDCGFHVMHFAKCAVLDIRINKCTDAFKNFKLEAYQEFTKQPKKSITSR